MSLGAMGAGVAYGTTFLLSHFSEAGNDAFAMLPVKIDESKILESASKNYVTRTDLESRVNIDMFLLGRYCVVYGANGAGKSEIVDHVAIGKKAVVKLMVTSAHTKDHIMKILNSVQNL